MSSSSSNSSSKIRDNRRSSNLRNVSRSKRGSVCPDVAFGVNQDERGLGSVIASGEGVQQGENTGIS